MAKRRKVGNMLGLAVLSTVIGKPMHPYEMASVLRERGKDQDMKIKWGSLYTVVQNLEKHGFIEAVESGRQGGRPERTVYRITDAGREEMRDWVQDLVATPEREIPKFEAALSVLGVLPPDDAIRLLRQRLAALTEQVAAQRAALDEARREVPRMFLIESEFDLALRDAEIAWLRSFLGELTDGSMPGMDQWRYFHETGQLPPELAELAQKGADPG
jgi:DNA-binding PadR family transcriptional regulator